MHWRQLFHLTAQQLRNQEDEAPCSTKYTRTNVLQTCTVSGTTTKSHLCLVLRTQVRVWQACGHVEHEGVVELAHLVGHVDVLAASLDHDLPGKRERWGTYRRTWQTVRE